MSYFNKKGLFRLASLYRIWLFDGVVDGIWILLPIALFGTVVNSFLVSFFTNLFFFTCPTTHFFFQHLQFLLLFRFAEQNEFHADLPFLINGNQSKANII